MRRFRTLTVAAVGALALGCSGKVSVSGRVLYTDGSPATDLADGEVVFVPIDGKYGASSPIAADGSFDLSSDVPGDGSPKGKFKVVIRPDSSVQRSMIDAKFLSERTTPLEVDLTSSVSGLDLTVGKQHRKPGEKPPEPTTD